MVQNAANSLYSMATRCTVNKTADIHAGLGKMWLFPDGQTVKAPGGHSAWLLKNRDKAKALTIDLAGLTVADDDQEIRLRALRVGMARVNYVKNGGVLTVEVMRLTPPIRRAIYDLIAATLALSTTLSLERLGMTAP